MRVSVKDLEQTVKVIQRYFDRAEFVLQHQTGLWTLDVRHGPGYRTLLRASTSGEMYGKMGAFIEGLEAYYLYGGTR
jgi:hypothetical protein